MARGQSYTRAADTWAVGCILYELMSLKAPWIDQLGPKAAAEGVRGLMRVVRAERLQVHGFRAHYSDELCALLCALVSRDPTRRPTMLSVISWPLMQCHAVQNGVKPIVSHPSAEPAGTELHAAATAIQQSVRLTRRDCRAQTPSQQQRKEHDQTIVLPDDAPCIKLQDGLKSGAPRDGNAVVACVNVPNDAMQAASGPSDESVKPAKHRWRAGAKRVPINGVLIDEYHAVGSPALVALPQHGARGAKPGRPSRPSNIDVLSHGPPPDLYVPSVAPAGHQRVNPSAAPVNQQRIRQAARPTRPGTGDHTPAHPSSAALFPDHQMLGRGYSARPMNDSEAQKNHAARIEAANVANIANQVAGKAAQAARFAQETAAKMMALQMAQHEQAAQKIINSFRRSLKSRRAAIKLAEDRQHGKSPLKLMRVTPNRRLRQPPVLQGARRPQQQLPISSPRPHAAHEGILQPTAHMQADEGAIAQLVARPVNNNAFPVRVAWGAHPQTDARVHEGRRQQSPLYANVAALKHQFEQQARGRVRENK